MAFRYVSFLDAVGTLYQEACVQMVDAKDPTDEAKWRRAAAALKECWPHLCTESVAPTTDQPTQ